MMRSLATITTLILTFLVACTLPGDPTNPDNPFAAAEQNKGSWTWIPLEESICRDGSSTGIGLRLQENAGGVMIYLQGGGACYDAQSCEENANAGLAGKNFSSQAFTNWRVTLGNQGVFNLARASNPVANWHHVYIPYCTGDLHGGLKANAKVEGVADMQQFMGYQNMTTFLDLLAPYFKDAKEVALVGASAGGFGVMFNYPQVAAAFEPTTVTALVDSAPLFPDDAIVTSCFQEKAISSFNLQLPADCPTCSKPAQNGLINLFSYLGQRYPKARFGFASADADLAGVILLDRESKACGGASVNIFNYKAALNDLRDDVLKPTNNWSTFYWGGVQHTMTQTNSLFFDNEVKGVSAADWWEQIKSGSPLHIAP